jgi:hypothetical protein
MKGAAMKIAVQGTSSFNDYSIFLRAMGTAMSAMDSEDTEISIFSAGPFRINAMATEFANISERSLRARGKKIRLVKVPPSWIKTNIKSIGYFAFFSKPGEETSGLVAQADAEGIDVGVYRY